MAASIADQIRAEIEKRRKEIGALEAALAALEGAAKPAKKSRAATGEKAARKGWTDERKARYAASVAARKAKKSTVAA